MSIKKTGKYIVRRARIKDIDNIRPLYVDFLKHHGRIDPLLRVVSKPDVEACKYLRKTIYGRDTSLWVAEHRGKIIGILGAGFGRIPAIYRYRDFGTIFDLYVVKPHRRRGVAGQLLCEAMAWFREKGIKKIEVGMSADNECAVKTWERFGFQDAFCRKRKIIKA